MKEICELANVNYQTYKGWKTQGRAFSKEKMKSLYYAMNDAPKENYFNDSGKITLRNLANTVKLNGYVRVLYKDPDDSLGFIKGYDQKEGKWFVEDKDWLLNRRVLTIQSDRNDDAEFIGEGYLIIYVD